MANDQKMNSRRFAIKYGFLILLVGLVIFFSIAAEGFAGPRSAVFIFQSVSITGILALGVTATLVVDGFDLSIGSVATSALMLSAWQTQTRLFFGKTNPHPSYYFYSCRHTNMGFSRVNPAWKINVCYWLK